ncbi:hypothetical protein Pelo_17787 [Pelomyxa schiedti]|nr:hypothetical protein Pelo_17787 [Pelomyxa schiedti]
METGVQQSVKSAMENLRVCQVALEKIATSKSKVLQDAVTESRNQFYVLSNSIALGNRLWSSFQQQSGGGGVKPMEIPSMECPADGNACSFSFLDTFMQLGGGGDGGKTCGTGACASSQRGGVGGVGTVTLPGTLKAANTGSFRGGTGGGAYNSGGGGGGAAGTGGNGGAGKNASYTDSVCCDGGGVGAGSGGGSSERAVQWASGENRKRGTPGGRFGGGGGGNDERCGVADCNEGKGGDGGALFIMGSDSLLG